MVVGRLGELGHAVDQGDRGGEVRELELAHDRGGGGVLARRHPGALARRSSISASVSVRHDASLPRLQSRDMRIVSLVPHATELLFALGAGPEVVGVTHECDFPQRRAG